MPLPVHKTALAIRCAIVSTALGTLPFAINAKTLDSDEQIERIIVTGSRVIERIDEVPSSVTVIDKQTLAQDMQVSTELQNILATRVPGMAPSTGTSSNSGQTLRGRNALIMIDGVPQSTPLRNGSLGIRSIDPSVIERIEVIKGATSIYGNGASGGIINYITKRAAKNEAISGEIGISSKFSAVKFDDSDGHRVDANISGTLDNFSYVMSGALEKTGLQRDADGDIIGKIYGLSEAETKNAFVKLGYQFDSDKQLQLTYNYYESQQQADIIDVTGSVNTGVKTYAIKNQTGETSPGVPQGPSGNHNLMVKYVDEEIFSQTQLTLDGYIQTIENMFFFSKSLSNPAEGYEGGQSLIKSDKQGIRVNFNTILDWDNIEASFVYGLDALKDTGSQPLEDGRKWVPEMDMTNLAAYLQTKLVINDDWVIKAGLRRDDVEIKVADYNTLKLCVSADTCSVPVSVKGGDVSFESTTYNFGIRYNYDDVFSPFASFSQGADISDLGRLLRTATVTDITLIHTEASVTDNYEVGFSGRIDDLSYEFAAYRSTSELGTSTKYDSVTGVYLPVRAPQKIWGYEAQLNYQFNSDIDGGISYSWIEGKDTEKDIYLDGKTISAPKLTAFVNWQPTDAANIGLTYFHVGDRKRFEAVDGKYVGSRGPISSYNIINLSSSYLMNDWLISLGVENLLNEDYYSARSQAYTYSGYNTKGLGTTVNLGIKYQF